MSLRVPNLRHGWRAFAGEVGIILDTMFDLPGMDGVEKVHVDKDVVAGTKEPVRVYANREAKDDAAA